MAVERTMRSGVGVRAGTAQVDISPQVDVHLPCTLGSHWPIKMVADPIFARALVLEQAGRKMCLVSTDLLMINRRYSDAIRTAIAELLDCEFDAVLIHAVQNHAAPSLGHFQISEDYPGLPPEISWMRGGDERYHPFAVERILQAVAAANKALRPAVIGADSGIEGRLAFCRRMVMRDGSIDMPRNGSSLDMTRGRGTIDLRGRYLEGPADPELGVICLRGSDLRLLGLLVHYTCHPVHVFPKQMISGDWVGAVASALVETYGDQCTAMVLNGACGNINPWDPYDPDYIPDHRRMGRMLAEGVGKVIERLSFQENVVLDYRSRHLAIKIREVPPDELEAARALLAQHPDPMWLDEEHRSVVLDWQYAHAQLDLDQQRQKTPYFDYEIQVFRLGDAAIVGLPGEPFVEGGLRIKLDSPTFPTYIAHNTSFAGYIPTEQAFQRGGYEIRTANWSKLAPEALDMIVAEAGTLLREVFD